MDNEDVDYEYTMRAEHPLEPGRNETFAGWTDRESAQGYVDLGEALNAPDVVFKLVRRRKAGEEEEV